MINQKPPQPKAYVKLANNLDVRGREPLLAVTQQVTTSVKTDFMGAFSGTKSNYADTASAGSACHSIITSLDTSQGTLCSVQTDICQQKAAGPGQASSS